jgi:hypothetical protein
MAFIASTSGHYYSVRPDGSAEPRFDADLRQARKEGLAISVTTLVKQVRANNQLLAWLKGQIVKAVEANPRYAGEMDDAYHRRIETASSQVATDAADFGTALHDALEHYPQPCRDPRLLPWVDAFAPWFEDTIESVWSTEFRMGDPRIGVAGTMDAIGIHRKGFVCCWDYKTQRVKEGKKPAFYDSWPEQLAFYAKCYQFLKGLPETPRCMSVVINSLQPERPVDKLWTTEEIDSAWRRFLCTVWIFSSSQKLGGFWPSGQWKPEDYWNA